MADRFGYGSPLGRAAVLATSKPRGQLSVTTRHRDAYLLRESGWSYPEIGKRYGVSASTVTQWVGMVRESIEDAANLAALRGE